MAFNEELALRIRQHLGNDPNIIEKRMFGGLTFLYKNKMSVGVMKDDLMVRVLGNKMEGVLAMDHVSEMKFTGKAMKEFVAVSEKAYDTEPKLAEWIIHGIEHAESKQ